MRVAWASFAVVTATLVVVQRLRELYEKSHEEYEDAAQ